MVAPVAGAIDARAAARDGAAMLLALLTLLQVAAADPAPVTEGDITVVAERMRRLKLATRTDRQTGAQRCVIRRASGDAAFDAQMCTATLPDRSGK